MRYTNVFIALYIRPFYNQDIFTTKVKKNINKIIYQFVTQHNAVINYSIFIHFVSVGFIQAIPGLII